MTVEQLSTSNISSTCPTGVNYISKYAGDLREKSHEVWTRNSNRSRCTAKKMTGGGHKAPPPPPPPRGIRVKPDSHPFFAGRSKLLAPAISQVISSVHLVFQKWASIAIVELTSQRRDEPVRGWQITQVFLPGAKPLFFSPGTGLIFNLKIYKTWDI